MKRGLTHAPGWGRSAVRAAVPAPMGGPARRRMRLAVAAALALLGALALATPASAVTFARVTSFDGSRTPGGTMAPERMAVDESTGNVYVIDTASGVVDQFNRYGRYLGQMVGATTPMGSFGFDGHEDDVAVDNSNTSTQGNVYVLGEQDPISALPVVTAFTRDGAFVCQANPSATKVAGVAVDPTNGDLWVGDRKQGMYRLSTTNCSSRGDVPVDASNDAPGHMAFDSVGNLYAAGVQDPLVKYTPPIADPPAATIDANGVFDVETDATNNDVYVDEGFDVAVYDSTGTLITSFGSTGTQLHGIAVDGAADHIYVENDDTNAVEIWAQNPPTMDGLTVTVDGTGTGNVDADHGAILGCGGNAGPCTDSYIDGDTVELTATADAGSTFTGWAGPDASACSSLTAPTCDVSMDAAKNITATFDAAAPTTHNLRVHCAGAGSGSVAPVGCGAMEAESDGSAVVLTATPDGSSTFSNWTGCDSVSANRCTVNMTADREVTATFAVIPSTPRHTLTVSKGGDGAGTVTSSPGGIGCGATCSAMFNEGTSVTLSAAADAGSTFAGWSGGGCSGTGTCAVSFGADTTVTATFTKNVVQSPVCPQDLSKCPPAVAKLAGFSASSLVLRVRCTGFAGQACSGKLTFKSVIKVRVRHGKKTKVVKKTITVATVSYRAAAGGTQSLKVKLTSAAKSALKSGALTARAGGFSIKLPKTKVRKKKKH